MNFKIFTALYLFINILSFSLDRIVSTVPSNSEILIDLGLGDKIIATDINSKLLPGISKEAVELGIKNIDVELLLSLEPDIVVASTHNFNSGIDPFELLKSAGIEVHYIPTPSSISEIPQAIITLGKAVGKEKEAETLAKNFITQIEEIKQTAPTTKKSIYFEINPEPHIFSFGKETFLDEMIEIAGGKNIFQQKEGWIVPTTEKILMSNPDIIFTNFPVSGAREEILARSTWQELDAIKGKRVYHISESSLRPSHRIITSLKEMSTIIKTD